MNYLSSWSCTCSYATSIISRKMLTCALRTLLRSLKWKSYLENCAFNTLRQQMKRTWWEVLSQTFSSGAQKRNEINSFRQTNEETVFEGWERFKDMLRSCPRHGIHVCIQMETFYNGFVPSTRLMVDTSSEVHYWESPIKSVMIL